MGAGGDTSPLSFSQAFNLTGYATINDQVLREMNERARQQLESRTGTPSRGSNRSNAASRIAAGQRRQAARSPHKSRGSTRSPVVPDSPLRRLQLGPSFEPDQDLNPAPGLGSPSKRHGIGGESPSKRRRGTSSQWTPGASSYTDAPSLNLFSLQLPSDRNTQGHGKASEKNGAQKASNLPPSASSTSTTHSANQPIITRPQPAFNAKMSRSISSKSLYQSTMSSSSGFRHANPGDARPGDARPGDAKPMAGPSGASATMRRSTSTKNLDLTLKAPSKLKKSDTSKRLASLSTSSQDGKSNSLTSNSGEPTKGAILSRPLEPSSRTGRELNPRGNIGTGLKPSTSMNNIHPLSHGASGRSVSSSSKVRQLSTFDISRNAPSVPKHSPSSTLSLDLARSAPSPPNLPPKLKNDSSILPRNEPGAENIMPGKPRRSLPPTADDHLPSYARPTQSAMRRSQSASQPLSSFTGSSGANRRR